MKLYSSSVTDWNRDPESQIHGKNTMSMSRINLAV